jgi:hypothetical protein
MGVDARPPALAPAALALALALALAACTTFSGLKLEEGTGGGDAEGTSSSSASTGAGGAGGALGPPSGAFLPLLEAAHVCALVAECPSLGPSLFASLGLPLVAFDAAAGAGELRFADCLDWLAAPLAEGRIGFAVQAEVLYCVAASSCDGVAVCLPVELLAEGDDRCEEGAPPRRCEDDLLIDCQTRAVVRCEPPLFSPGTGCVTLSDEDATCGIPSSCDQPLDCSDTFAVICDGEVQTTRDCALHGLSCNTSASETAGCVAEDGAQACDPIELGEQRCSSDGERAYACVSPFRAQTDCSALGLDCEEGGLAARCVAPDATCAATDPDVDVCEGATLHTCVRGEPVDVDCAAIGRTCSPAVEGPSGSLSGRCAKLVP